MKKQCSFADNLKLKDRPDANLLLTKPSKDGFDVHVIMFSTRAALEAFNKKANLHAVIKTQVPKNCAIYKHQSDSDARKACPRCASTNTSTGHHAGDFAIPECDFKRCDDCGQQWDHS